MATATGTYATTALVKTRLGITDTTDDTLIGTLCDQVNQYIETRTGRVLAPISSATYLFDGNGRIELWVPMGIRAISLLEIAAVTRGTFATINSADYFLRPTAQDRKPGWPATRIRISDYPVSGWTYFPRGYENVRVTMTAAWAAMPDDVIELALTTVVRAWHARQAGQTDIIGTDETGAPIVSRYLSARDRQTLHDYANESPVY